MSEPCCPKGLLKYTSTAAANTAAWNTSAAAPACSQQHNQILTY